MSVNLIFILKPIIIMNKKIFLVLLTAVLTASYAQAQLTFGARAGLNFTNVKMKMGGISASPDMKVGIQLGVVGEYGLSEAFFIQPGIVFAQQGYKVDMFGESATFNLNYIQIPVNAQYKVDLSGMKLLLQAGPYLGYAVNGKVKAKVDGKKESEKIEFGDGGMKRFDFGLGIGAGLQFGNIQAGVGYNIGLANIASTDEFYDDDDFYSVKTKTHNNGIVLTVTYFFGK